MKHWFASAFGIDKGFRRSLWRIDRSFQDQQIAGHQKQFLEREHEMLAVVDQPKPQCDIELAHFNRIEIVNRLSLVIDFQTQHATHKLSLANQIALRIDTQYSCCSAVFHLDRIEAGVAAN